MHACMHIHTDIQTDRDRQTYTHTYTHTYIHTYTGDGRESLVLFGHPARGGLTSFVSGVSLTPALAVRQEKDNKKDKENDNKNDKKTPAPAVRQEKDNKAEKESTPAADRLERCRPPRAGGRRYEGGGGVGQGGGDRAGRREALGLRRGAILIGCFHAEYKVCM